MGFSELFKIEIFVESILFFWNWSLGFVPILLYSWYMLVNLINLGLCEKLKILGLVIDPNGGYWSNLAKLTKLACSFDVIGHYFLKSILYDNQFVNFLQIDQVVFQNFGVFVRNSMLKPNLWTWTNFELNCNALGHASLHLICSCII